MPLKTTEGPLGFPLTDKQSRHVETLLKALPKSPEYAYRRLLKSQAASEVNPGERSDVSWISTQTLDRDRDVMIAKGLNDSQYALNPIVTLNHSLYNAPVGRSLWRKRVKDGDTLGIKAKTQYPSKPASWPDTDPWAPDKVFALVQSGLLNSKSIGFLPLKVHFPDAKEQAANGWPDGVRVVDEWLLLEYAVCTAGVNQEALVEAVSKSADPISALELLKQAVVITPATPPAPLAASRSEPDRIIAFTPVEELHRVIAQRIDAHDFHAIAQRVVQDRIDLARGRV